MMIRIALSLLFAFTQTVADNNDAPPESKIVGGEDVPIDLYPWFAKADWNGISCGGMLVTQEFILTAAHCMGFGELDGGWDIGAQ